MTRILYLVPGVGLSEQEIKRRERIANTFLTNDKNEVIVEGVDEGPLSIESTIEESMSVPCSLKKIADVQHRYDAVIIGCLGDPGLAPARELADIPVIGPFESSLTLASMLGEKFSIVTVLDSIVPAIRRTLREYGLDDRCASVRVVNCPVLELGKSKEKVVKTFLNEAKKAVEQDGASTLILGCMSMAFLLVDEAVRNKLEVPIINPAKASIKFAEMWASLGLSQSRRSYPRPDYRKLQKSVLPNIKIEGK